MRSNRPQAGFTLIEVAVVLAIVIIIASLATIDFRTAGSQSSARGGGELLVSDLRSLANRALHNERFQGASPAAWGIRTEADSNTYILFADLNGDGLYQNKEKYKSVTLGVDSISVTWEGEPAAEVTFIAGTAKLKVGATVLTSADEDVSVKLKNDQGATIKEYAVNWLGAVSIPVAIVAFDHGIPMLRYIASN